MHGGEKPHFRVSGTIDKGKEDDIQRCSCWVFDVSWGHQQFAKSVTIFCRSWQHAEVLPPFYICWEQAGDEKLAPGIASVPNVLHFWCWVSCGIGNHRFPCIWSYHCWYRGGSHHGLEIFQIRGGRLPFFIQRRESEFLTTLFQFGSNLGLTGKSRCLRLMRVSGSMCWLTRTAGSLILPALCRHSIFS